MKSDWKKVTLGDVCKTTQGIQIQKSEQENVLLPNYKRYLYISDFKNDKSLKYVMDIYPNKVVTENDLIVVNTGASAGDIFKGKVGILSNNLFKVTIDQKIISPAFIYYFVNSHIFKKYQSYIVRGSANPHMGHENFNSTPFSYPPLPKQKRIVAILDEAFAAIAKAKANAELNLKNAKELFESYLQEVFENKGEGWEEKTLGDVCEFRNGAAHEQHIDENGKYILVNSKFISADGEKMKRTNSALAHLFVNDIAFVMSDVPKGKALAKCFLVDKNDTYTLNQRIGAIKSKVFIPEFLIYQFNRNKYLLSFDNGENQTNLRKGDILECPLFVPSKEQQQTIVHQLDALRDETQKLEAVYQKKITDLDELKKSILQKAFSGELKTEKILEV